MLKWNISIAILLIIIHFLTNFDGFEKNTKSKC